MTIDETTSEALGAELRTAIESQIAGVELLDKGTYYTVKLNGKTLGYVNGKRKIRVDFPVRGGEREQTVVTKPNQIPGAVAKLESFATAREAKTDAK